MTTQHQIEAGGPGSGSWEGPGDPRFARTESKEFNKGTWSKTDKNISASGFTLVTALECAEEALAADELNGGGREVVLRYLNRLEAGGPGSGSWEGPGDPRFAWTQFGLRSEVGFSNEVSEEEKESAKQTIQNVLEKVPKKYIEGLRISVNNGRGGLMGQAYLPPTDKRGYVSDQIILSGSWLDKPENERRATLLHEIGHRAQLYADKNTFSEFKNAGHGFEFPQLHKEFNWKGDLSAYPKSHYSGEAFAESYAQHHVSPEVLKEKFPKLHEFWDSRSKGVSARSSLESKSKSPDHLGTKAIIDNSLTPAAQAIQEDLEPLAKRLTAILGIQDPDILKNKAKIFIAQLPALLKDINADPASEKVFYEASVAALFNGLTVSDTDSASKRGKSGLSAQESGDLGEITATDEGGVWRTVHGTSIFIKDGQDLGEAVREKFSGDGQWKPGQGDGGGVTRRPDGRSIQQHPVKGSLAEGKGIKIGKRVMYHYRAIGDDLGKNGVGKVVGFCDNKGSDKNSIQDVVIRDGDSIKFVAEKNVRIPPKWRVSARDFSYELEAGGSDDKFGCLMAMLPSLDSSLPNWAAENVTSLTKDGIETEPHVTAYYGFNLGFDSHLLEGLIAEHGPYELTLGKLSRFKQGEYDVLKFDVSCPNLVALNKAIAKQFKDDITPSEYDYHPHMTLAYVLPGTNEELDGARRFYGHKLSVQQFLYSEPKHTNRVVLEASFCPTGEGGGVDPTCSPGTGSEKQHTDHFSSAPTDKAGAAKWIKSKQNEYNTNKEFRAAVDSATLLTQGSTNAIYAASLSAAGKADLIPIPFYKERLESGVMLSQANDPMSVVKNYFKGHPLEDKDLKYITLHDAGTALNKAIDNSTPMTMPIYRGVQVPPLNLSLTTLSKPIPNDRYELIKNLKKGDVFSIHGASSFTSDKGVADDFARGLDKGQGGRRDRDRNYHISAVLFEIQGAHGIPVAALSPWKQKEVLSRGTFKVLSHVSSQEETSGRATDHHIILEPVK